ncbi:MAG: sulfite exporter TauE/SafE family protein [Pseudomonadota bacterium]
MLVNLLGDGHLLLAVFAIIAFAGLVHGTLGLGFPMVATPMLAVFLDVRTAILVTLLPTVAVNLVSIWRGENSAAVVREYAPMLSMTLLGALVGAWMLAVMDPSPFRLVLAVLIVLYLWANVSGRIPRRLLSENKTAAMLGFGILAGLSGGTTNVMVAILIVYFLSLGVSRDTMVPALNSCFLIGKLSQILVLSLAGFVSLALMFDTAPLAAVAVVALLVGQKVQRQIEVSVYRRMLHVLLIALSIILAVQFYVETVQR